MTDNTYTPPPHGWTCFHCGENFPSTFAGQRAAKAHFGAHPDEEPGCVMRLGAEDKSLVRRLRAAEAELARYRSEDSDKDRQMVAMAADHAAALRREEELGYARGLRDTVQIEEALMRYRYAIGWAAADSWDHCGECRSRLEWASATDLHPITSDQMAAVGKLYRESAQ